MEEIKMQPEEKEIDLLEVFCVLWNRARLLLLSLVAGAILAGAGTYLVGMVKASFDTPEPPKYRAVSTIYAFSVNPDVETFLMELELSSNLAADFRIVATTREVVEAALDDCGMDKSYEDALKTIGVNSPTAHMLRITVTDEDPQQVADFSNALSEQMKLKIAEVMGIRIPSTVERATVPDEPLETADPMTAVMENVKRNCILGGVVFLVLAAGAVLLVHFVGDGFKEKMAVIRGKKQIRRSAA